MRKDQDQQETVNRGNKNDFHLCLCHKVNIYSCIHKYTYNYVLIISKHILMCEWKCIYVHSYTYRYNEQFDSFYANNINNFTDLQEELNQLQIAYDGLSEGEYDSLYHI